MGPLLSISFPRTLLRQLVHELRRCADALDRAYPPPQYSAKDLKATYGGRYDPSEDARLEADELDRQWALEQAAQRREIKLNKREDL